jgi:hypothetical protein
MAETNKRKFQWKTAIDPIIRLSIIFPLVILALYLTLNQGNLNLYFSEQLPQRLGFAPDDSAISFLSIIGSLIINMGWILALMMAAFIVRFKFDNRVRNRMGRALILTLFLVCLGFLFWTLSSFFLYLVAPETNAFSFLSDTLAGLSTEIMGAWLVFILIDTFAKTWEENEEQDALAVQSLDGENIKSRLAALLVELEQAQTTYQQQAKTQIQQSFLTRLTSPSRLPAAYYEGQATGLGDAINHIQKLLNELESVARG